MAGPESGRSAVETFIHYNNYLDAGVLAIGVITANPNLVLLGAGGLIGGKFVGDKIKERRESGKFVV